MNAKSQRKNLIGANIAEIETPAFVIDMGALEDNLKILGGVQNASGATILLALKGYATWSTFPLVKNYLKGISASSPHEAKLGREEHGGQVHCYAPVYTESELNECLELSNHLVFNSMSQWKRFKPNCEKHPEVKIGLRINPEHSEVEVSLYDPCAKGSRLGITRPEFDENALDGISGLHFHSLCELGADALVRTLRSVEKKYGHVLSNMDWINFGGGHAITKEGYDHALLIETIKRIRAQYGVNVFLEPGSAIGLNAGVLISSVVDIVKNGEITIAILDTSATAHMPDVLEMPYRPAIVGGGTPNEKPFTYRLGGTTCLAGDVIGDWSFDAPLEIGQKIVFLDMAHYTMVKTTNFNGVRLPDIGLYDPETHNYQLIKRFGYESYKCRLS